MYCRTACSVCIRKVLRPANSINVFRGFPWSQEQMLSWYQNSLPMVTLKISPYNNVTLTSGWTTLFMGDMGEGALNREERNCQTKKIKSGYVPHWGGGTKMNCPTHRRSQYNLKLNLRHCTANSDTSSRQRGRPTSTNPHLSKNNQREKGRNWWRVPDGCLTPRRTGRLTVGRNITLTLTLRISQI
jgi:hypothetical protein